MNNNKYELNSKSIFKRQEANQYTASAVFVKKKKKKQANFDHV